MTQEIKTEEKNIQFIQTLTFAFSNIIVLLNKLSSTLTIRPIHVAALLFAENKYLYSLKL